MKKTITFYLLAAALLLARPMLGAGECSGAGRCDSWQGVRAEDVFGRPSGEIYLDRRQAGAGICGFAWPEGLLPGYSAIEEWEDHDRRAELDAGEG